MVLEREKRSFVLFECLGVFLNKKNVSFLFRLV